MIESEMLKPYGRIDWVVTCACGFRSGPHRAYDTATWIDNGHAVQCRPSSSSSSSS